MLFVFVLFVVDWLLYTTTTYSEQIVVASEFPIGFCNVCGGFWGSCCFLCLLASSKHYFQKNRQGNRNVYRYLGKKIYKRLTENGTIKSITQIGLTKIGYQAIVTFRMALSEHNSAVIVDMLVKIPDLTLIIKTSGDYDISVFIMVKDLAQMLAMQRKIAMIPGITRLETKVTGIRAPWPGSEEYISTF